MNGRRGNRGQRPPGCPTLLLASAQAAPSSQSWAKDAQRGRVEHAVQAGRWDSSSPKSALDGVGGAQRRLQRQRGREGGGMEGERRLVGACMPKKSGQAKKSRGVAQGCTDALTSPTLTAWT